MTPAARKLLPRRLRAWWRQLDARAPVLPPFTVRKGGIRYPAGTVESVTTDDQGLTVTATIHDPTLAATVRGFDEAVSIATDQPLVAAGGWCAPSEAVYDLTARRPRWRLALTWLTFHARCWLADRIDPRARWTQTGATNDSWWHMDDDEL